MRYERVGQLGRGGMGVVDLGRGPDGAEVALKRLTLHGSAEDMARARQRIQREAEVLTRLHHPNIVELLDVVDDGDDVTLVMAYLTGGTLADRVARHGPVPPTRWSAWPTRSGSALAEAHRAGVVHRDIKPGNVLFDAGDVPHLADFGVASSRDDTAGLTAIGTVVGTAGFMAPGAGRAARARDRRATCSRSAPRCSTPPPARAPTDGRAAELLMVRAAQGKVRPIPRSLPASLRRAPRSHARPAPRQASVGRRHGRRSVRHGGATVRHAPPSSLADVGGRRWGRRGLADRRPRGRVA